jgi:hypothetical protein
LKNNFHHFSCKSRFANTFYTETLTLPKKIRLKGRGGRWRFFRAREPEAKKSAKARKKAKAPSAKEKSANSPLFFTPTLEAWFQSP